MTNPANVVKLRRMPAPDEEPPILRTMSWTKDRALRFTSVCETVAEAAGVDGPASLIGLTDHALPWRDRARFYEEEEALALAGHRVHQPQFQMDAGGRRLAIVVTKSPLRTRAHEIVGTIGSSVDVTDVCVSRRAGQRLPNGALRLGPAPGAQTLTPREVDTLRELLLGGTAQTIGDRLRLSPRTVEQYSDAIRSKFAVQSRSALIARAFKDGFAYLALEAPAL